MKQKVPADFDPRTICLTIDVEWAGPDLLSDLIHSLNERDLTATMFVTHEDVKNGHHERGIHPNFRGVGDVARSVKADMSELNGVSFYNSILASFKAFAPEAVGVRSHSLHYDSLLLPLFQDHGLEYDSTYQMPLVAGIMPFWKEYGILELPIFFSDFFELKTGSLEFDGTALTLDEPGLKVIDIHPHTFFVNATSLEHYNSIKANYHDKEQLLQLRHRGSGIRTMMLQLFDRIADCNWPVMTLGEVNTLWRT